MTTLWDDASYDAEAEDLDRKLTGAREAATETASFLFAASSKGDYENRKALMSDQLDKAAAKMTLHDPVGFAVVRSNLESSLDQDFFILAKEKIASRKTAVYSDSDRAKIADGGIIIDVDEAHRLVERSARDGGRLQGDIRVYALHTDSCVYHGQISRIQVHTLYEPHSYAHQTGGEIPNCGYEFFWAKSASDTLNQMVRPASRKTAAQEGPIGEGPNGYVAFYKGREVAVYSDTTYHAQLAAAEFFGAKKSYEVDVMLATKDGEQVVHLPLLGSKKESALRDRVIAETQRRASLKKNANADQEKLIQDLKYLTSLISKEYRGDEPTPEDIEEFGNVLEQVGKIMGEGDWSSNVITEPHFNKAVALWNEIGTRKIVWSSLRKRAGERRTLTLPYSEVNMHMNIAGKTMEGELVGNGNMVQLYSEDGSEFSFPITAGEAGWDRVGSDHTLTDFDETGKWYPKSSLRKRASVDVAALGPNGPQWFQSKGQFHLHRAGCADIPKLVRQGVDDPWYFSASSQEDVLNYLFGDIMSDYGDDEENSSWEFYVNDVYYAPCISLPRTASLRKRAASSYGWMVDQEWDSDHGQVWKLDTPVFGPSTISEEMTARLQAGEGQAFQLWNDDGDKDASGRWIPGEEESNPLWDYGFGNFGSTRMTIGNSQPYTGSKRASRKKAVSAGDLNSQVEFDSPFEIGPGGTLTQPSGVWGPSVYDWEGNTGDPDIDGPGWEFVDGYSGQQSYSGPVMHASEYLGGGMAQDVLDNPGIYVITSVEDMVDQDSPHGWALLKKTSGRKASRKTTSPGAARSRVAVERGDPYPAGSHVDDEGEFRVDVAGVGENVWVANALTFTTYEQAKAYSSDLMSRWMGADMARVVPSSTPKREEVFSDDETIVENWRTGSRRAASVNPFGPKTAQWAGYTLVDESKFSDEFHRRFVGYFESEDEAKRWAEVEYGVPSDIWGDRVYLTSTPGNPEVTVVDGREVPFVAQKGVRASRKTAKTWKAEWASARINAEAPSYDTYGDLSQDLSYLIEAETKEEATAILRNEHGKNPYYFDITEYQVEGQDALFASRKRGWTEDGSDITPGALKLMSLQDDAYDAAGVDGFGGPDDPRRQQVIDYIVDALGDASGISAADVAIAEDYNSHAAVEAWSIATGQRVGRKTAGLGDGLEPGKYWAVSPERDGENYEYFASEEAAREAFPDQYSVPINVRPKVEMTPEQEAWLDRIGSRKTALAPYPKSEYQGKPVYASPSKSTPKKRFMLLEDRGAYWHADMQSDNRDTLVKRKYGNTVVVDVSGWEWTLEKQRNTPFAMGSKKTAGPVEGAGAISVIFDTDGVKWYLGENNEFVKTVEEARGQGFFESAEQWAWSVGVEMFGAENMGPIGGAGGNGTWNYYAENPYLYRTSSKHVKDGIDAEFIRTWLFTHWIAETPKSRALVECILSNKENWSYLEARGEKYRGMNEGADWELETDDMGVDHALGFALTALTETEHAGPHKSDCRDA